MLAKSPSNNGLRLHSFFLGIGGIVQRALKNHVLDPASLIVPFLGIAAPAIRFAAVVFCSKDVLFGSFEEGIEDGSGSFSFLVMDIAFTHTLPGSDNLFFERIPVFGQRREQGFIGRLFSCGGMQCAWEPALFSKNQYGSGSQMGHMFWAFLRLFARVATSQPR